MSRFSYPPQLGKRPILRAVERRQRGIIHLHASSDFLYTIGVQRFALAFGLAKAHVDGLREAFANIDDPGNKPDKVEEIENELRRHYSQGIERIGYYVENCNQRVARKRHVCVQCTGEILSGQQYVEYVGETPPFHTGSPYCLSCAEVWKAR